MAYTYRFAVLLVLLSATVGFYSAELVEQQPLVLKYHNGILLKGNVTLNLVWYGKFTPIQRSIIVDFIRSLNSAAAAKGPSVASWWKTTEKYKGGASTIVVGKQLLLENYPLGKSLKSPYLRALSGKLTGGGVRSITVVLTAKDVAVEGFCMNRCGTHGSKSRSANGGAYVWVGNSETQCPGYCAWPFHQPIYGPQSPPLIAPNGDVGVDGMIINLATLLVNTVTNPFKSGYFNGAQEAVSACTGIFGSGAYPGYAGRVLVDKTVMLGVGKHAAPISLDSFDLLPGRSICGSLFGGLKSKLDIPILVDHYLKKELNLDSFITHELKFEEINKAFDLLEEGKSLRCIIWMDK